MTKVCFQPCKLPFERHETWKDGRIETHEAPREPPQVDIYKRERSGIIERLESGLHPHAPWRDPREVPVVASYRPDSTPLAHTLAGACVWLRTHTEGQHDCSADLLWCVVMQDHCHDERRRVQVALMHAWLDVFGQRIVRGRNGLASINEAARMLVQQVTTGIRRVEKVPIRWELWQRMEVRGERMLWSLADKASSRAMAALGENITLKKNIDLA